MTEELAVDGAFGYGTAVDGEVPLTAPGRVVVYDAWDDFLAHAALADDQHTEVGGGYLQSHVEGVVQIIAVAYDVVAQNYAFYLRILQFWQKKMRTKQKYLVCKAVFSCICVFAKGRRQYSLVMCDTQNAHGVGLQCCFVESVAEPYSA